MNVLWLGWATKHSATWFHEKMEMPPVGWRLGDWWFFGG